MKSVVIFNILRTYKDFILFKTQQATTKARRQILKREKSIQAFSHLITETLVVYCRGHQQIDFIMEHCFGATTLPVMLNRNGNDNVN